jgi:hypothetical protein
MRRHVLPIGLRRYGWRVWLRDLAHACVIVLFTTLVVAALTSLFIHPGRYL